MNKVYLLRFVARGYSCNTGVFVSLESAIQFAFKGERVAPELRVVSPGHWELLHSVGNRKTPEVVYEVAEYEVQE